MERNALSGRIAAIFEEVEKLVPVYMENEEDGAKAGGSVAICIIDEEGCIYGRMFGLEDKIRARERYKTAWLKASQVWITGVKTGEYERLVFNNEIDEKQSGIRRPDYIGWEGGQPVTLPGGELLAVGFSGFRSSSDLEIIVKAVSKLG